MKLISAVMLRIVIIPVVLTAVRLAAPGQTAAPASTPPVPITREQAEQTALKNNPQITAGRLLALAQGETTREARAAELPQISGNATAVDAEDATRIGAGALTSSSLYTHAGAGGTLSQLIADFGYTHDLIATAKLRTRAQQQYARATEQDIVFAADQAFYRLLAAQAMLDLAQQTVAARKSVSDQIGALTASKLRSDLDLNIAAADLSQGQLLELDAQNEVQSASAALAALLAAPPETEYKAIEPAASAPAIALTAPPAASAPLEAAAIAQRPDLAALHYDTQATQEFARAQRKQSLPSISALAVGGITPVRPDVSFPDNWYAAAGVNLNLPIFSGFRISAQAREAQYRAQAKHAQEMNLANMIQRDVRTAALTAQTAYQRIGVAEQFKQQAAQALSLAQTRYQLGLSSIVELSQAQLQSTQAAVSALNARYAYLLALRSLAYVQGEITP
jgi:outer membrane protein